MENNKKESRQSAVSIGNKLREARENKSFTIEQVQKATKIHSTVLLAIEEGRASDLLTDTYIKSFLKKYAQFLGINSVELLKEYYPAHAQGPAANIQIRENTLPKETTIAPKFLYMTGITVVAVISIFLFIFLIGKIASSIRKAKVTQQNTVAVAKKKSGKNAKTASNKKSAVKNQSGPKELIPRSVQLNLVIRVKEPVLVQLKKDGVVIFNSVLTKGVVESVVANESIELGIGKAEALDLILNGRPILLPANKVKFGLDITRKGVKIR